MTTDPTSSSSNSSTPPAAKALADQTGSLGEDAFMQLLITQLKNQDPTQPQDGSQFVAQLAQFSSLEKLTSMNDTLTKLSSIDTSLTTISQLLAPLGADATAASDATTTTKS